jgi:MFS transporter, DHA2 family, multidrug resistance protein
MQLWPEQSGALLSIYGALPIFGFVPLSIYLLRRFNGRAVVLLGFRRSPPPVYGAHNHDWARYAFVGIILLLSASQAFFLLG